MFCPSDLYSLALRTQPFELQTLKPLTSLSLSPHTFSLFASPPTKFLGSTTPCPAPHHNPSARTHAHSWPPRELCPPTFAPPKKDSDVCNLLDRQVCPPPGLPLHTVIFEIPVSYLDVLLMGFHSTPSPSVAHPLLRLSLTNTHTHMACPLRCRGY